VMAAQRLAPRTVHVHVKDAAGHAPGHEFPPLGRGQIDLLGVAETLREGGYGGVASVEWEAHGVGGYDRDDELALEGSRQFMKEQLGI
jgi:sugar phosphate isomerase/epimerase